jgi:hypothetical protein
MGITCATTRVACTTSDGNQDITTSDLGGLTPKAALLILMGATTDGTAASDLQFSYGAATGSSNRWCIFGNDEDGQATSDTACGSMTDAVCYATTPGTTTETAKADFSSWITNGIRINWSNAPASAYLLTVVFFAGTDLSAYAGSEELGNTTDLEINVTDPGFEPDVVFTAKKEFDNIQAASMRLSIGAVHNGVSVSQRALSTEYVDNQGTTINRLGFWSSYGIAHSTNSLDWGGEFTSFDSDGFSVITRNAGANNTALRYLALNFGGVASSWVGTHTTPTSTGNDSDAGPSFTPQLVLLGLSLAEGNDTIYQDNRAGSFGLAVFDADDEYTGIGTSEDAVATTNTQSLSDDRAIVVPDDDGTLDIEASFVSMDANGWTVNYSNAPATAKLFLALAIGAAAATTSTSTTTTVSSTSTSTSVTTTSSSTTVSQSSSTSQTQSSSTSTSVTTTSSSTTVSQSSSTSQTQSSSTSTSVTTTSSSTTVSQSSSTSQTQSSSTSTSVTTTSSSTTVSQSSSTSTSVTTTSVSTSTTLTASSSTSISTTATQSQSTSTTTTVSLICCCCHTMFRGMYRGMYKGEVPG